MPTLLDSRVVHNNRISSEERSPAVVKTKSGYYSRLDLLIPCAFSLGRMDISVFGKHLQLVYSMPHFPVTLEIPCGKPRSQKRLRYDLENHHPINHPLIFSTITELLIKYGRIAYLREHEHVNAEHYDSLRKISCASCMGDYRNDITSQRAPEGQLQGLL